MFFTGIIIKEAVCYGMILYNLNTNVVITSLWYLLYFHLLLKMIWNVRFCVQNDQKDSVKRPVGLSPTPTIKSNHGLTIVSS